MFKQSNGCLTLEQKDDYVLELRNDWAAGGQSFLLTYEQIGQIISLLAWADSTRSMSK